MKRATSLIFLLIFSAIHAQSPTPADYFESPLDVPIVLSGTFGELRSNHFHSGLDIKTQGREGLNVKASATGYISRINIQHYGYGKALYVQHPNGYTTVYAHLQKLAPKIRDYVRQKQYEKESYEIELFPEAGELKVEQGEVIGDDDHLQLFQLPQHQQQIRKGALQGDQRRALFQSRPQQRVAGGGAGGGSSPDSGFGGGGGGV